MKPLTKSEAITCLQNGENVSVFLLDGKKYRVSRIRESILSDFDFYLMYHGEDNYARELFIAPGSTNYMFVTEGESA